VKYGLGTSISDEVIRDAKFDVVADIMAKMADSAKETQEVSFMNMFNNAFGSQNTADGEDLCDTGHLLPSGLTWSNRLATDADLSQSSLQQALIDFEKNPIGDTGIRKMIKPRILLVPSELRPKALELVKSELKPDTMDNNMNYLKDEGLVVVSSPHLTDTDAWFLLSDKADHSLCVIQDYGVQTKGWEENSNDTIIYKSRYRETVDVFNAYGVFGTTGAA
jgi:phage major head subunit gpT-like protein